MITGRQIRAARGLLGWDAVELATKAGLTRETVSKIENDSVQAREDTLARILRAFDQNGIEFTDNSGVRLKPQNVETFEGKDGFFSFYNFVYDHISNYGGDVCVTGVDEKLFVKYQGDFADIHMDRMAKIVEKHKNFKMRILVEEGDYNFVASSYAHYKWQSKKDFLPTSFYVFGDQLALISFTHEPAPLVILIKSACFAEAYRHSFDLAWASASEPKVLKGAIS
jgi:transcriptional regulator with XRE-family HTH domain